MEPILVIGGGPKAAAIAAKRAALIASGFDCPEIIILERTAIASYWNGNDGYTSGELRLGTPPEKDVGFPYPVVPANEAVCEYMLAKFSWSAYRIMKTCKYGEWIDRGRPHPQHKEWGHYIKWVVERSGAEVVFGNVTHIAADETGWRLTYRSSSTSELVTIPGSAIVVTGSGPSKKPPFEVPQSLSILYGDNFWNKLDSFIGGLDRRHIEENIAVVGGGETAASIVSYLIDRLQGKLIPIMVITRGGALYSRGEGYYENRMFTDHTLWPRLSEEVRKDVIRRGDKGVFSVDVVRKISHEQTVRHKSMEVASINTTRKDGSDRINRQEWREDNLSKSYICLGI